MAIPDVSGRSISDLLSLDGRVALVTGGARGIGRAVADRLSEAGASVAIGDIDEHTAKETATALAATGRKVIAVSLDVTDPQAVSSAVDRTVTELGSLDILVNNAGIFPPGPFLDQDETQWRKVLDVNVDGAMRCSRAAARHMAATGRGVIVNVTSIEAYKPSAPGLSAYVTSKHALDGLTKAMALELGPVGIRVLAVAPTLVRTPGVEELLPIIEAAGLGDIIGQLSSRVPLGRAAEPDDVGRMVLVCASDLAMLMTGSTVLVDAGAMTL